jgi:hypothetical protein
MNNHMADIHVSKMKTNNTLLLADSHTKYQNPRVIEKALRGRLFAPGYIHPGEHRAYCSTRDWPNAHYPENNLEDKVMELLRLREHSYLMYGAPGNDITNIGDIKDKSELYR